MPDLRADRIISIMTAGAFVCALCRCLQPQVRLSTLRASFRFGKVDQLTLSACDTAMGSGEGAGREVEGLAVVAQLRGARPVMATLWSVADSSTGTRFYTRLREGLTKAEALRQTQQEFIEGKIVRKDAPIPSGIGRGKNRPTTKMDEKTLKIFRDYRHPFYWAPFILMGNWL
jgi:CHAT domain-containing protein